MKKVFYRASILIVTAILLTSGATDGVKDNMAADPLESGFANPPDDQRVGCYWYWIDEKITKEGVIADLHAMKKAGITRAYVGLTGGGSDVKFLSEAWWEVIHTAMKTATELDIEIGMFNCPGWSQSGGPWVKPSQSMRYLTNVQRTVTGPKRFSEKMPFTDEMVMKMDMRRDDNYQPRVEDFQDVKVLAFPVKPANTKNCFEVSGAKIAFSSNIAGGKFPVKLPEKDESSVTLTLPQAVSAQGLQIRIDGAFRSQGELQAKVGG
ncbi:MAG: glycoside hydrolase family 2, partial [Tannerella sp.]|nr:glycoside hydrolase family 2 [Tannerella sp.]